MRNPVGKAVLVDQTQRTGQVSENIAVDMILDMQTPQIFSPRALITVKTSKDAFFVALQFLILPCSFQNDPIPFPDLGRVRGRKGNSPAIARGGRTIHLLIRVRRQIRFCCFALAFLIPRERTFTFVSRGRPEGFAVPVRLDIHLLGTARLAHHLTMSTVLVH